MSSAYNERATMPDHESLEGEGSPCPAVKTPGYVTVFQDGRWNCNRCGYLCDPPAVAEQPGWNLSVDLRRAAISVVLAADSTDLPFHYGTGIMLLWDRLTGLEGTAALALARRLADSPNPVTAHVPPM